MTQDMTLQERWSSLTLDKLRKTSLFVNLFNTRYQGQPTAGAVKVPVRDTEVKVSAYDKVSGGTLTVPSTDYKTLVIDQDNYVNELIDGFVASAVPDDLVADRLDSAGYSMGIYIDEKLRDDLLAKATKVTKDDGKALTNATIYANILSARTQARKALLKTDEMWLVVSPETLELLLNSPEFIRASALGDTVVQSGAIGTIAGIRVYEADELPTGVEYILGNSIFTHYVAEWLVPVALTDLKDGKHIGSSAVQGRQVFGDMISRPETVFKKLGASA